MVADGQLFGCTTLIGGIQHYIDINTTLYIAIRYCIDADTILILQYRHCVINIDFTI